MNEKSINGNERGAPLSSVWDDDNEPGDDRADATNHTTGACRSEDRRHVYCKRI